MGDRLVTARNSRECPPGKVAISVKSSQAGTNSPQQRIATEFPSRSIGIESTGDYVRPKAHQPQGNRTRYKLAKAQFRPRK